MSTLKAKDYHSILTFYNVPLEGKTRKTRRNLAEQLLATKLCRCIKKVARKSKTRKENRAIPICRDAVIKRKGYRIRKFTCKKRNYISGLKKL
jgi:hypothetical protein